jgi:predicted aconitase
MDDLIVEINEEVLPKLSQADIIESVTQSMKILPKFDSINYCRKIYENYGASVFIDKQKLMYPIIDANGKYHLTNAYKAYFDNMGQNEQLKQAAKNILEEHNFNIYVKLEDDNFHEAITLIELLG